VTREAGHTQKKHGRFGTMLVTSWRFAQGQSLAAPNGLSISVGSRTPQKCLSLCPVPMTREQARKESRSMAVAHTILVIGYHSQKHQCDYPDLGGDYFDRLHADGLKRYLVRRLESLGHKVALLPQDAD